MIRNTNIRLKLGVDEIKNDIQKSRSIWYEHVMQMTEEKIPKKMPYSKMEEKHPRGRTRPRWED